MDTERFDAFVGGLARFGSRRRLLAALAGGGLAAVLARAGAAAEERGTGRRRDRRARRGRGGGAKPKGGDAARSPGGATGRISNGTAVPQGTYTFAASIQVAVGPTSSVLCTGSLIDPAHVLTAAHCAFDLAANAPHPPAAYAVVVGQVDNSVIPCAGCHKRVTAVAIDPAYVPAATVRPHDVAVLTLDSPVDPAIARPIDVVVASNQAGLDAAGRVVTAAGWGATATDGAPSPVLRQAPLTVLGRSACRADSATIFCTSVAGGLDTCSGDSGAPLFVEAGGFVQVGVVSGGPVGCPSQGRAYGALNVRLSNPAINAFVRAAAPGTGPHPPPPPPLG